MWPSPSQSASLIISCISCSLKFSPSVNIIYNFVVLLLACCICSCGVVVVSCVFFILSFLIFTFCITFFNFLSINLSTTTKSFKNLLPKINPFKFFHLSILPLTFLSSCGDIVPLSSWSKVLKAALKFSSLSSLSILWTIKSQNSSNSIWPLAEKLEVFEYRYFRWDLMKLFGEFKNYIFWFRSYFLVLIFISCILYFWNNLFQDKIFV